jgi:hypothetical protein
VFCCFLINLYPVDYFLCLKIVLAMRKYAKVTTREVLDSFHSDSEYGLSTTSVSSLKKTYGANKLPGEVKVRN